MRISTVKVGLNDSYRYGKINEVDQSALSKTDKDHDSTPISDRNEILRQINTGPQHKQRQLGFEKSSTELSNPKIG